MAIVYESMSVKQQATPAKSINVDYPICKIGHVVIATILTDSTVIVPSGWSQHPDIPHVFYHVVHSKKDGGMVFELNEAATASVLLQCFSGLATKRCGIYARIARWVYLLIKTRWLFETGYTNEGIFDSLPNTLG